MEKLKLHSPDLTQENIAKLAELFPGCVTETQAEDGKPKRAIDFDQLRQELSTSIVEGPQERYQLNWPGKREALLTANAPIAKTLRPCREESVDFDTTQNLFIEGDNLDALKLLQETYLNKVKMIYIDPPYNTGNDFIYEDDFAEDTEAYLERSNQKDDAGNRMIANSDSNGRFHSDWLSMMYSRIKLSRNLLKEDGVIFISIDEKELANLKRICDEVFGENNFVSIATVVRSKNGLGSHEGFATNHDNILVYKKSDSDNSFCYLTHDQKYIEKFNKSDKYGTYKMDGIFRKKGDGQKRTDSPGCFYPIYFDSDGIVYLEDGTGRQSVYPKLPDGEDGRWIWTPGFARDKLFRLYASTGGTIYVKDYLHQAGRMKPKSVLDKNAYITEVATEEIKDLFGKKVFDTPKPTTLLLDLIDHACDRDGICLDFFSGSATTAHSLMALNATDNGNRRYILVQLPDACDEKSEAFKAGYKTIAEIGKERIRRAGKKIKEDNAGKDGIAQLDIGFRVLKIDSSNMKDVYYAPDAVKQGDLLAQVDNIREDRTAEDLLFQVLLDWGVDLALPITQETIAGKKVFFVDGNALAACFETGINEEFVKALAARHPLRAVFRDSGFGSDSVKINIEQIFKLVSPTTEVKSI